MDSAQSDAETDTEPAVQPQRILRILNLGAGVQSTALFLMFSEESIFDENGDPIHIDAAIFADTQEEPQAVYDHLERLKKVRTGYYPDGIPIYVRTKGKLGDDLIKGTNSTGQRFASIPAFTTDEPGVLKGITKRQCTKEYKTEVIERCIRRDLLGLQPRQRIPKNVRVAQYFGLSYDEPGRIVRVRAVFQEKQTWADPFFPLFTLEMTRRGCIAWLKKHWDWEVPRSACVMCPFHSNEEWARIRDTDPEGWKRAVEVDHAMRTHEARCAQFMQHKLYVHKQCVPLDQADLRDEDTRRGQAMFGFAQDCEGMCGL